MPKSRRPHQPRVKNSTKAGKKGSTKRSPDSVLAKPAVKNKQPAVVEDDETTESDDDGAQLADCSSEPATFTYDDTRLHPLDHRAFVYPELLEISAEQQRAIRGDLVLDEFFERTALRAGLLHDQIDDAFNRDDKKALSTINKKKARLSNGVWQVRHQGSWRI